MRPRTVAQEQTLKRAAPRELILKHLCLHPEGPAGALHDGAIGHGVASHEECDADQPLVTCHAHLGGRAVLHQVEQRDEGGGREIDVALPPAGFIDDLAEREGDVPQVRQEALIFLPGRLARSRFPVGPSVPGGITVFLSLLTLRSIRPICV